MAGILDSSILIDCLRGRTEATSFLAQIIHRGGAEDAEAQV